MLCHVSKGIFRFVIYQQSKIGSLTFTINNKIEFNFLNSFFFR